MIQKIGKEDSNRYNSSSHKQTQHNRTMMKIMIQENFAEITRKKNHNQNLISYAEKHTKYLGKWIQNNWP